MNLYLILHAEAEPQTPPEQDAARLLVEQGHNDIQRVGAFATAAKPNQVGAIYHAQTTRALETAEGFAKFYRSSEGVIEADGLLADDHIGHWLTLINESSEDLMIVGHMLNLKRIAGELIAGDASAHPVRFKRGGVACLERSDDGVWGVAWMINPDMV
ncbi:MAG: hypothetical protein HQ503_00490 [Rhodospirillales bacterium]|nr:hypothetical protein [Rhodospirillales bacterium]